MSLTIRGRLVRFLDDGQYIAAPIPLEGAMVEDEEFGWVLEFALPTSSLLVGELSLLIGIDELLNARALASPAICRSQFDPLIRRHDPSLEAFDGEPDSQCANLP